MAVAAASCLSSNHDTAQGGIEPGVDFFTCRRRRRRRRRRRAVTDEEEERLRQWHIRQNTMRRGVTVVKRTVHKSSETVAGLEKSKPTVA